MYSVIIPNQGGGNFYLPGSERLLERHSGAARQLNTGAREPAPLVCLLQAHERGLFAAPDSMPLT